MKLLALAVALLAIYGLCELAYREGLRRSVRWWRCGCGHDNGINLATCAACSRPPGGWPEEQVSSS